MASIIDRPSHYCVPGIPESADLIRVLKLSYNVGTAFAYIYRAGRKTNDPLEDLQKAIWHLNKECVQLIEDKKD